MSTFDTVARVNVVTVRFLQTRTEYLPRPWWRSSYATASVFVFMLVEQHLSSTAHRKWRFSFILQNLNIFIRAEGKKRKKRSISIHLYSRLRCCETTWGLEVKRTTRCLILFYTNTLNPTPSGKCEWGWWILNPVPAHENSTQVGETFNIQLLIGQQHQTKYVYNLNVYQVSDRGGQKVQTVSWRLFKNKTN